MLMQLNLAVPPDCIVRGNTEGFERIADVLNVRQQGEFLSSRINLLGGQWTLG
ncbi:hypothetical protein SB783_27945 [Paraburkholderia sp. SIMBA_009]|nr:hypothetical protein [Paraburkholderia tropica]QNB17242.1 hypothetical protein G5S35_37845 [Paraburkholderia tropica]